MNILVIGSGGREHTLSWKISQSPKCDKLFIAPGNAGTLNVGQNVNINPEDFDAIKDFIKSSKIEMVVVGPEAPLVKGIRDYLEDDPSLSELVVIGPGKSGARLEGSKDFSKEFMVRHEIPTARSATFSSDNLSEGLEYLRAMKLPIVLKADGLAAGKGVIICESLEKAQETLKEMIRDKMFGEASSKVLVEEFLSGIELSVFVLTDGESYKILPEAKDYKRIGEGDTGPNTGGMGAVTPVPFANAEFMHKVETRIIIPTINGLKKDNIPYVGFLFIGLMNVEGEPFVIEYNVRMGDPETQAVMPRVKSDLVDLFLATRNHKLGESFLEIDPRTASTVVMVAGGYPGSYEKGKVISGMKDDQEYLVFHAGTALNGQEIITNGGRILAITGMANDLKSALEISYKGVNSIKWEGEYHRKDIGQDILTLS